MWKSIGGGARFGLLKGIWPCAAVSGCLGRSAEGQLTADGAKVSEILGVFGVVMQARKNLPGGIGLTRPRLQKIEMVLAKVCKGGRSLEVGNWSLLGR